MNKKILALMLCLFGITASVSAITNSNFTIYYSVGNSYDHTISFNANCSGGTAYFVENDTLIDGNGWKLLPYDDASKSNACQSSTASYFTVTITGTATTELDINATAGNGEDVNLKIYKANTEIFCGADGNCNGWEETCSITDGQVTNNACLQVGTGDAEFDSLASGASGSYCMCADFNATGTKVSQGDHAETVGITSRAPD